MRTKNLDDDAELKSSILVYLLNWDRVINPLRAREMVNNFFNRDEP